MKTGVYFSVTRVPCTLTKPARFRVAHANFDGRKGDKPKYYSVHGDIDGHPHLALLAFLREAHPHLLDRNGEFDELHRDLVTAASGPGSSVFIVTHKG